MLEQFPSESQCPTPAPLTPVCVFVFVLVVMSSCERGVDFHTVGKHEETHGARKEKKANMRNNTAALSREMSCSKSVKWSFFFILIFLDTLTYVVIKHQQIYFI